MTKIYTMLLQRVLTTPWILLVAATALLTGCAGKSSPSQAFTGQAPVSQQLVITTTTLATATYGQFYDATLQASGGVPPYQWFAVQGDLLSIGLTLNQSTGEINGILTGSLAFGTAPTFGVVDSRFHTATRGIDILMNPSPVKIINTILPPATVGHPYFVRLQVNQPVQSAVFALDSGALPTGITMDSHGTLSGTPKATGSFQLVITASDNVITSGIPVPSSDQHTFTFLVVDKLPRNDQIAAATALSSGQWSASISPYHDSSSNGPDEDFYALSAPGGSYVSVNIFAERNGSPLDSVLEIVDQNGQRFRTCSDAGISTAFTNLCMNDDIIPEFTLDSMLTFKVPGTGSQKFFVHVLDWRGDARPDMLYQMSIIGAD